MDFPDLLRLIPQHVPDEATAIGFVARNDMGQVLLVEPEGHYQGVSATFPKVQIRDAEPADQALTRCLRDKVGAQPESIFPVPGLWATGHSRTKFFTGLLFPGGDGSRPTSPRVQAVHWSASDQTKSHLLESKNSDSRKRDLGVLEALDDLCVSPYRRQLLALLELHRMGFERLRALAYMAPSGCYWRCEYRPVSCFDRRNGALPSYEALEPSERQPTAQEQARYSSADGQIPFGWRDAVFDPPRLLAEKLLERRRDLVFSGMGADPAYVEWFEQTLEATKPFGVFSAFDDYSQPDNHVQLLRTPSEGRFKTAPPGEGPPRR